MNSKRLHFALIGIICLLLIALAAGTYGANHLLTSQANKLTALKAKSIALSQQQTNLIKARKDIQTYADLQKITSAVVPEDKNQAEAVREIVNIAGANGISLSAINFPASTLGGGATASGASTTASSSPVAAGNAKTNGLSQLQPVKSIPGVYELTITVQGDPNKPVPYNKFISFLSALEHNRRTAQVSTINIQPDKDNRAYLSFDLSLNEYIKP